MTECNSHLAGACLVIVCWSAILIGCPDSNRVDTGGVTISSTGVPSVATISSRPHIDGALSSSTLCTRCMYLHGGMNNCGLVVLTWKSVHSIRMLCMCVGCIGHAPTNLLGVCPICFLVHSLYEHHDQHNNHHFIFLFFFILYVTHKPNYGWAIACHINNYDIVLCLLQ